MKERWRNNFLTVEGRLPPQGPVASPQEKAIENLQETAETNASRLLEVYRRLATLESEREATHSAWNGVRGEMNGLTGQVRDNQALQLSLLGSQQTIETQLAVLAGIGEELARRVSTLENAPSLTPGFPAEPPAAGIAEVRWAIHTDAPLLSAGGEAYLHHKVEMLARRMAELGADRPTTHPLPSVWGLFESIGDLEERLDHLHTSGSPAIPPKFITRVDALEQNLVTTQGHVSVLKRGFKGVGDSVQSMFGACQAIPPLQQKVATLDTNCKRMGQGIQQAFGEMDLRLGNLGKKVKKGTEATEPPPPLAGPRGRPPLDRQGLNRRRPRPWCWMGGCR